jgi:hypothetical protein
MEPEHGGNAPSMDDIDNRLKARGYLKGATVPEATTVGGGSINETK